MKEDLKQVRYPPSFDTDIWNNFAQPEGFKY